mmetsp:Transcript_12929/g.30229  ORF Transcript_12929/g.30229 Transcript_12929/m.30229 type:complete len:147 (-) Transcript_12929:181-621(-)
MVVPLHLPSKTYRSHSEIEDGTRADEPVPAWKRRRVMPDHADAQQVLELGQVQPDPRLAIPARDHSFGTRLGPLPEVTYSTPPRSPPFKPCQSPFSMSDIDDFTLDESSSDDEEIEEHPPCQTEHYHGEAESAAGLLEMLRGLSRK